MSGLYSAFSLEFVVILFVGGLILLYIVLRFLPRQEKSAKCVAVNYVSDMKNCPKCGTLNHEGQVFCTTCRQRFPEVTKDET